MRSPKARAARSARIRFARSRDANEPSILAAVARAGWHPVKVSDTGLPDILALHPDGVRAVLLEVKVPGGRRLPSGRKSQPGRLTTAQETLHARLARAGWTVHVVRDAEEALAALSAVCAEGSTVEGNRKLSSNSAPLSPAEALAAVAGGPVRTARDVRVARPKRRRALLARLSSTSLLELATSNVRRVR
ncbi:MAG: VRR-NUC domain-containing protein [Myxococcaceae bacterium]|nr:VRR-NUC domain-containing protein [Myxococcaceae bacterium]